MHTTKLSIANNCKKSITKTISSYKATELGKAIVHWAKKYPNLDYSLRHMWVIKHDCLEYKRGDKLFYKPNVPYRDIYFYEEDTRKALTELLDIFDMPARNQIGFTKGRGIQDLMQTHPENPNMTRIKLDLKDAFNSITQEQIYWLLRKVFDVNKRLANNLSHNWTTHGHMLQGHPLAPAIFNLVTRDLNMWLSERTGIIQYADDILIYENTNYISWKWLKVIMKKFKELGFEMNVEKEGIYHNKKDLEFLGLRFTFDEEKPLVSAKRKFRRKKIRELERNTNPENPVLLGNKNWYNFNAKRIVLNKIQSQINNQNDTKSGYIRPKRTGNKVKGGDKNQLLKDLYGNPAAFIRTDPEYFKCFLAKISIL